MLAIKYILFILRKPSLVHSICWLVWGLCCPYLFPSPIYKGMRKFHPGTIWCCDVSESRLGSLSLPSLWLLDLLRALRQSDAYTCLRLFMRGSEVGSRDVIPLANTASFISLTQPGPCHIISPLWDGLTHTCLSKVLIWISLPWLYLSHSIVSYESYLLLKTIHFPVVKTGRQWLIFDGKRSEFHSLVTVHCSHPPPLQHSLLCGLFFPLYISSFF